MIQRIPLFRTLLAVITVTVLSPMPGSAQTELRRDLISSGSGTVTSGTGGHIIRGSIAQTAVGRTEHGEPGPGGGEDLHLIGFWYRGLRPDVTTTVSFPMMEANTETQITVPLTLETTGSVGPFVPRGFTARVRFNGTLLHPIGSTPACTYDGSFCTIEITGTATVEEGVIANLQFLTAPTSGFYLHLVDTDLAAPVFTVTLQGTQPATHGGRIIESIPGQLIGWPFE